MILVIKQIEKNHNEEISYILGYRFGRNSLKLTAKFCPRGGRFGNSFNVTKEGNCFVLVHGEVSNGYGSSDTCRC